jgi:class 3 adenylate cyclase
MPGDIIIVLGKDRKILRSNTVGKLWYAGAQGNILDALFSPDSNGPALHADMLARLAASHTWQGIVHVKSSLGGDDMLWHEVSVRAVDQELFITQRDLTMPMHALRTMYPRHILDVMSSSPSTFDDTTTPVEIRMFARNHPNATIMFADIVGFTSMCCAVSPHMVMLFLNRIFALFESLCDLHAVSKVETAGDCFIASSGILTVDRDGYARIDEVPNKVSCASHIMDFSCDVLRCSRLMAMPHNQSPVSLRIGVHSGDCISGLIGSKMPKFAVFGDTMNTASRMESTASHDHIQVSASTFELLRDYKTGNFVPTAVDVKGKGVMLTYAWVPPPNFFKGANDAVRRATEISMRTYNQT